MSDTQSYIAEMLRISRGAYAAHATEELLERHPECGEPFGDAAFRDWRDNLTQRVTELAVALEMQEPSLFSAQLEWSRDAFAARRIPVEHLRHSLECLRTALRQDLPEGAADVPVTFIEQALDELADTPARDGRLRPDSETSRLALQYLEAVLSGQRRRAIRIVLDAVAGGLPVPAAYEQILLPAQVEVGVMWHLGEITVSEEHAATETTRRVMSILSQSTPVEVDRGTPILLATVEGDRHDIGVHAVADLLELTGFRVIALGADVPVSDLARAVDDFGPDTVVVGASLSLHLRNLRRCIEAVRELPNGSAVRIIVGGPAFAELPHVAERLGADGFAASPGKAVELVRQFRQAE